MRPERRRRHAAVLSYGPAHRAVTATRAASTGSGATPGDPPGPTARGPAFRLHLVCGEQGQPQGPRRAQCGTRRASARPIADSRPLTLLLFLRQTRMTRPHLVAGVTSDKVQLANSAFHGPRLWRQVQAPCRALGQL